VAVIGVGALPDLEVGLANLAGLLVGAQPLTETLALIAGYAVGAIPGADGVGLALDPPSRVGSRVLGASSDLVRSVDEVQYRLDEGPCLQAVTAGSPQVSGSLGGERRWPRFGPQAGRLGVHSALALPLRVQGRIVGALNVYGRVRDAFDERAVRVAEMYARPAAVSAVNAQMLHSATVLAEQLDRALTSRATIDQAIGVVMSRSGASVDEAFDYLRGVSRTDNVKVSTVARRIVDQAVRRARARRRPVRDGDGTAGVP
jgi:GAF domain-containing protein